MLNLYTITEPNGDRITNRAPTASACVREHARDCRAADGTVYAVEDYTTGREAMWRVSGPKGRRGIYTAQRVTQ